jgi:hypothetical protein
MPASLIVNVCPAMVKLPVTPPVPPLALTL